MLYDKETRGREQQTNSLRFTLVHPSYSSLSLSFSRVIRTMREKKKKKLVLRLLVQVYIYIYIAFEFSKITPESCTRVTKG